jgi:hypothetical protein
MALALLLWCLLFWLLPVALLVGAILRINIWRLWCGLGVWWGVLFFGSPFRAIEPISKATNDGNPVGQQADSPSGARSDT